MPIDEALVQLFTPQPRLFELAHTTCMHACGGGGGGGGGVSKCYDINLML